MGVEIKNVTMNFGDFRALKEIDINIEKGEFFSILGPSGCGKTTLLKIISGFLEPSDGAIYISGDNMKGVTANKRPTSLVFQNLALFPSMSVKDNIAFGLKIKKLHQKVIDKEVASLLKMVSLEDYENSMVDELSGGQKQRVAIARALAVKPKVLLLDEPLSALDLKLRQHMRKELRALQKLTGITFIYITHDQGEALSMSDKVAVMSKGNLEQVSTPEDLYNNPKTPFVASFVGENNEFDGKIIKNIGKNVEIKTIYGTFIVKNRDSLEVGDEVKLFVRPERFSFKQKDNAINLQVNTSSFEGSLLNIYLKRDESDYLKHDIILHKKNNEELSHKLNEESVTIYFDDHDAVLLKAY